MLPEHHNAIVSHLIYPIPDPAMPFLGVHLTRMIDGSVTVGPNAVLALKREGYRRRDVSLRDLAGMAANPGILKVLGRNWRPGLAEMKNSWHKRGYLALVRKYCPSLTLDDLEPYPAGVRARRYPGTASWSTIFCSSARRARSTWAMPRRRQPPRRCPSVLISSRNSRRR